MGLNFGYVFQEILLAHCPLHAIAYPTARDAIFLRIAPVVVHSVNAIIDKSSVLNSSSTKLLCGVVVDLTRLNTAICTVARSEVKKLIQAKFKTEPSLDR